MERMTHSHYNEDDLVYVDPDSKTVIGPVAWDRHGNVKPLPYKKKEGEKDKRKYYPCGTYRSMKNAFRLGGKPVKNDEGGTLDDILPKVLHDDL